MWLLPAFSWIARTAAGIFYRLEIEGELSQQGPVLLVANHPNSLLDPALVVAAAKRPVRFLAKAPLFSDRKVGWLVRAVGSIPVVRKMDQPDATAESNEGMFAAAHRALAEGAAIGLFPEGTSHSDPSLKPLKTGAARIALGAARAAPRLQIVPVGLVFRGARGKATFRAPALVLLGEPIAWDDLRDSGTDPQAVQQLTEKIELALRQVTVNAERLEDLPLLELGEAIWRAQPTGVADATSPLPPRAAERPPSPAGDASARLRRLSLAARLLSHEREAERHRAAATAGEDSKPSPLLRALRRHGAKLARLGLEPADLAIEQIGVPQALSWSARRIHLLGPPALALALLGYLAFWLPFRLTGWVTSRIRPSLDQISTHKLMVGAVIYGFWVLGLATAAAIPASRAHPVTGLAAFVLTLVAVVLCGLAGLLVRERWRNSTRTVRHFLLLQTNRTVLDELRREQVRIGEQIAELVRREATESRSGTH